MSDRLRSEWNAAFDRYVSTCHTGGTPEQRSWAFARALVALEKLMLAEPPVSARETQEVEAV